MYEFLKPVSEINTQMNKRKSTQIKKASSLKCKSQKKFMKQKLSSFTSNKTCIERHLFTVASYPFIGLPVKSFESYSSFVALFSHHARVSFKAGSTFKIGNEGHFIIAEKALWYLSAFASSYCEQIQQFCVFLSTVLTHEQSKLPSIFSAAERLNLLLCKTSYN